MPGKIEVEESDDRSEPKQTKDMNNESAGPPFARSVLTSRQFLIHCLVLRIHRASSTGAERIKSWKEGAVNYEVDQQYECWRN